MTGFAEKMFYSKSLWAKVSIKSLNHRFFDWNYRGDQIGEVENGLRAISQKRLHRGRIEVSLELNFLDPSNWELHINQNLLAKVFTSLDKLSSRVKTDLRLSAGDVFRLPHLVELRRKGFSKEQASFLEKGFEKTLDKVLIMRRREGREIAKEIQNRLKSIGQALSRIGRLYKKQPFLIRERMRLRLKELDREASLSEERLAEEAAYFAQRYDLAEEIMRLKSHLDYARQLISPKKEEPAGRKLDFIAQELYREANTINSKSQDVEITRESLAIKGEVEGIRQQVQNIE
jgi:uncharacterized protein (TIGR00255 family)